MGVAVGWGVGNVTGVAVGWGVGNVIGVAVGWGVGNVMGVAVGWGVGNVTGVAVGWGVGVATGVGVAGMRTGVAVGAGVELGAGVGAGWGVTVRAGVGQGVASKSLSLVALCEDSMSKLFNSTKAKAVSVPSAPNPPRISSTKSAFRLLSHRGILIISPSLLLQRLRKRLCRLLLPARQRVRVDIRSHRHVRMV